MVENIHPETYSLLINTYIKEPTEQEYLFNTLKTFLVSSAGLTGPCTGSLTRN
jgi:hypothetical protein